MYKLIRRTALLAMITLLSTFVVKGQCVGDFLITTTSGDTVVDVCSGNANNVVRVVANIRGYPILYVLTDGNGIVLNVTTNPVFNFSGIGGGSWRIYAATFKGRILQPIGEPIGTAEITTFCWEFSDNYVTIGSSAADMSTIQTTDGKVDTSFCVLDGMDDWLVFEHTPTSNNYAYIVTDDSGVILSVTDDSVNFDGAGTGTCIVYGIDYDGNLLAMPGQTIDGTKLADGCYVLSDNQITVDRFTTEPGTIMTTDSMTQLIVCVGDSVSDSLFFMSPGRDTGANYVYIVTDFNDTILRVLPGNVNDFEGAGIGICRVYGVAYSDSLMANPGMYLGDISTSGSCLGITPNYVEVFRSQVLEDSLTTTDGETMVYVCLGDSATEVVTFDTLANLASRIFIVTDTNNVIIGLTDDPSIDFGGAGPGICLVWRAAYNGVLEIEVGDTLFTTSISNSCNDVSLNSVEVIRGVVAAGVITTTAGDTSVTVCVGDSIADEFMFVGPYNPDALFTYIITNDSNQILRFLHPDSTVDFEGGGIGTCHVYGLSYLGTLWLEVGDDITQDSIASACYDWTDNYVEVIRTSPMEGRIETTAGDTTVFICPGDSLAEVVILNTLGGSTPYVFIVTDEDDNVVWVTSDTSIDFSILVDGNYYIYRSSYTGSLVIEIGDTLFVNTVSDGCSAISENSVLVGKATPAAGIVTTTDGDTTLTLCVGDTIADEYMFAGPYNQDVAFTYVITDDSNRVLRFLAVDSIVDFNSGTSGTCRVYGLSYNGMLLLEAGDDILQDSVATSCYDWSDNYVEVIRNNIDPGVLFTQYGTEVFTCPGDGEADELILTRINNADTSVVVIVDTMGIVQVVTTADTIDVDSFGEGASIMINLSFSGDLLFDVGDTLMDIGDIATGCFAISEPVFIIRSVPYSDTLSMVSGDTLVEFCTADGIDDVIVLNYGPKDLFPVTYVVTDTAGFILATPTSDTINFEGADAGTCYVYAVAYTGLFTGQVGENIGSSDLSDDCYAISDNYITVIRNQPDGGIMELADGTDMITICGRDTVPDIIHYIRVGGEADSFQYVITDTQNIILALPNADSVDFNNSPLGICRIWSVGYYGTFIATLGDTAGVQPLSDDCYGLSANFITVIKDTVEAGSVSTVEGDTVVMVNTSDTLSDIVQLMTTGASSVSSSYVVTDGSDIVLLIIPGVDMIDFGMVPAGEYRIYNISYTGTLTLVPGFNITLEPISDDCYDYSDNFVQVLVSDNFGDGSDQVSLDNLLDQGQVSSLKVYPNPVKGRMFFSNTGVATDAVLMNTMGQIVAQRDLTTDTQQSIDVYDYNPGLYILVTYRNGELIDQQQVMIQ